MLRTVGRVRDIETTMVADEMRSPGNSRVIRDVPISVWGKKTRTEQMVIVNNPIFEVPPFFFFLFFSSRHFINMWIFGSISN